MEATAGLFLTNYVYQIPVFIVWIVGGIMAIARWQRHPRPSLLLVVALSIFLLRALVVPIASFSLVHGDLGFERMGMAQGVVSVVSALVAVVAWILVLAAALGWREEGQGRL